MDLDARKDDSFHVNAIILPLCPYGEALKGKIFIFNEEYMKKLVAQSVISMLLSHLQCQPSAELGEVIHELAL